jgi:hypothetical protein
MTATLWVQLIVAILGFLGTALPVVLKLIEYIIRLLRTRSAKTAL